MNNKSGFEGHDSDFDDSISNISGGDRVRRDRSVAKSSAVAALAVMAGASAFACGISSAAGAATPSTAVLAHGQQGPASEIPWSSVGNGWSVAMWSSSTTAKTESLFVVDPVGGRYLVSSTIPAGEVIVSWSGDAHRVLLTPDSDPGRYSNVNLANGATISTFSVPGYADISYTRPDGLAILANVYGSGSTGDSIERMSVDGQLEVTYPHSFSKVGAFTNGAMETPNGLDIVMGAMTGVAVVANAGNVVSQISIPRVNGCMPLRWWSNGDALVSCGSSYWLVPLSGGAPKELLSTFNENVINVFGTANGGLYGQAAACGYEWIVKLGGKGTPPTVRVPGVPGSASTVIVGSYGDDLEVLGTPSCNGGNYGGELMFFNPANNSVTSLLGNGLNGGVMHGAVAYSDNDTVGSY